MSFPCNLLFTTCSAAHRNLGPFAQEVRKKKQKKEKERKREDEKGSQTMKCVVYGGILFIVQFPRSVVCVFNEPELRAYMLLVCATMICFHYINTLRLFEATDPDYKPRLSLNLNSGQA